MAIYTPPVIKDKLGLLIITDPNKAADTNIDLAAYQAKLDLDYPYPIVEITLMDITTATGVFVFTKYTTATYGTAGSLAAGQHCVVDEDTFRIGKATNAAGHQYILTILAQLNRILNT